MADKTRDELERAVRHGIGGMKPSEEGVADVLANYDLKEAERVAGLKKENELRRVREKQIRALRSQYRPAGGALLTGSGRGVDLGTAPGLPNKLGAA